MDPGVGGRYAQIAGMPLDDLVLRGSSLKGTLIEPHQIATIVTKSEIGIMPNGQPRRAGHGGLSYCYRDQAYLPALKVASDPVIGGMRADAAGVKLQPRMRKDGTLGGRLEVPFTERLVGAKTGHFGFMTTRTAGYRVV